MNSTRTRIALALGACLMLSIVGEGQVGQRRTIGQIVTMLSDFVGRPVIDRTGLTGLFDVTLKFAPEGRHTGPIQQYPGAQTAPVDPDVPSLSAALQEQLGLKLESARGPVEVVVIDRFERPTPD